MERILVTLLLVVISVGALVAVESWFSQHRNNIIDKANTQITLSLS